MTDHNDMEDPQAGEILPPMLFDAYWESMTSDEYGVMSYAEDVAFKKGMEYYHRLILPHLKAALPYYEAGLRDTQMGPADAGKLAELAIYQEITNYVR